MEFVSGFDQLIQELGGTMTAPSFQSFRTVLIGWVFATRRTITQIILAVGDAADKHFSSYHRLFSAARWCLDTLGLVVFDLIIRHVNGTVLLALDDTLARKRGSKIFGVGMHHDPLLSSRGKAITNWGHSWVVLGVLIRFPLWPKRVFCLPVLFRLYLPKAKAQKHRRKYRTRPELALEMLSVLCGHRPERRFHLVADSAYGGKNVLSNLPPGCDLTSRLLKDARLYEAPPERKPGTNGRPRKRGQQLPTPKQMLAGRCRRVSLTIYGRQEQARLAEVEARVHAVPERPLRVVAVEALKGGRGQEVFYSTCHDAQAEEVITWYSMRWSVEVAFHDSKQHLGFEQPQGWTRRAVQRTAPIAMLLYSLIVLWFVQEGHRSYRLRICPWYTAKKEPSFADMLVTLRRQSIRQIGFVKALAGPGSQKVKQLLENTLSLAA